MKLDCIYGFGHYAYYENMLKCIKESPYQYAKGKDGLKDLELLIAEDHLEIIDN